MRRGLATTACALCARWRRCAREAVAAPPPHSMCAWDFGGHVTDAANCHCLCCFCCLCCCRSAVKLYNLLAVVLPDDVVQWQVLPRLLGQVRGDGSGRHFSGGCPSNTASQLCTHKSSPNPRPLLPASRSALWSSRRATAPPGRCCWRERWTWRRRRGSAACSRACATPAAPSQTQVRAELRAAWAVQQPTVRVLCCILCVLELSVEALGPLTLPPAAHCLPQSTPCCCCCCCCCCSCCCSWLQPLCWRRS